jgi:thioredoxin-dependent peroxiredoxin
VPTLAETPAGNTPGRAGAAGLQQGDTAPPFHLIDQNGNGWSLADFEGQFLVVFFEDATDPERSRRLVHAFREQYPRFKRHNTRVVGISPRDSEQIQALAAAEHLNFNLLADTELEAARLFGALEADLGTARTASFLIGPDGAVLRSYKQVDDPDALMTTLLSDLREYTREEPE